jgi:hypothetical protein
MFVCSVRASTLKFAGIIGAALIALAAVIIFVPDYSPASTTGVIAAATQSYNYEKIKTNEDRIKFLSQFGWSVEPEPVDEAEITLPGEFDRILKTYNELQKSQGLNLERYRNKKLMRYTYKITNYPNYNGTVFANVIIYKNRVVGGDICSTDYNGFIHGFNMQ